MEKLQMIHPMVIHFPIVLILLTTGIELLWLITKKIDSFVKYRLISIKHLVGKDFFLPDSPRKPGNRFEGGSIYQTSLIHERISNNLN